MERWRAILFLSQLPWTAKEACNTEVGDLEYGGGIQLQSCFAAVQCGFME